MDLKLVKVQSSYSIFLKMFDDKVPINYYVKETRPFVGVLLNINDVKYFAPLSSPKSRHKHMKSKIDFLKIDDGKLGVINFNNMIPVFDSNFALIDFNVNYKYKKLLYKQIFWINRNKKLIFNRALKLYVKYIENDLIENIKNRCVNFTLLEEKCLEYNGIFL